jgi:hypothetical protein
MSNDDLTWPEVVVILIITVFVAFMVLILKAP